MCSTRCEEIDWPGVASSHNNVSILLGNVLDAMDSQQFDKGIAGGRMTKIFYLPTANRKCKSCKMAGCRTNAFKCESETKEIERKEAGGNTVGCCTRDSF